MVQGPPAADGGGGHGIIKGGARLAGPRPAHLDPGRAARHAPQFHAQYEAHLHAAAPGRGAAGGRAGRLQHGAASAGAGARDRGVAAPPQLAASLGRDPSHSTSVVVVELVTGVCGAIYIILLYLLYLIDYTLYI